MPKKEKIENGSTSNNPLNPNQKSKLKKRQVNSAEKINKPLIEAEIKIERARDENKTIETSSKKVFSKDASVGLK